MSYSCLTVAETAGVVHVTLNRPEALNSINDALAIELLSVLDQVSSSRSARVLVLSGTGRAFCAGQDLKEIDQAHFDPSFVGSVVRERYNRLVTALRTSPLPCIAAVGGIAAGAGACLALCCDFVIASEDAVFSMAFIHIGLLPDTGGTYLLPRIVGDARARALCLLGERIDAGTAEKLGLIYRVAAKDSLDDETRALADRLAALPRDAIALTKQALLASTESSLDSQLELEAELQMKLAQSFDFQEGVRAFKEKRPAKFR